MEIIEPRSLNVIAKEIKKHRKQIEQNAVKIGELLCEAKAILVKHGDWKKWLEDNFDFSHRTANRLMRIYQEFSNSPALANIGLARTKADILLRLPDDEREAFMAENNIEELSTRELEKRVREIVGKPQKEKQEESIHNEPVPINVNDRIAFLGDMVNGLIEHIESRKGYEDYEEVCAKLLKLCNVARVAERTS
jgi:hypothetical protein